MNWNHYPRVHPGHIEFMFSRFDPINFSAKPCSILPYGNGRSYSDCCLNENNILLSTKKLNRFISFDIQKGLLSCEAGTTLAEILSVSVPHNWFLPVLPGTQHVTLGGAIANDIHGKNHFRCGSFGCHVIELELLRSDGKIYICSLLKNQPLFYATIGGLGLTGIILSATIQLKPIVNPFLLVRNRIFHSIDEFLTINFEAVNRFEYCVAWMDAYHERGYYISADHYQGNGIANTIKSRQSIPFPVIGHPLIFNSMNISLFNQLYFHRAKQKPAECIQHYQTFFFPLDKIKNWNRIYGRQGFLQYQCVLPTEAALKLLLNTVRSATRKSSLMVIKNFGSKTSHGSLSFPQAGITIAMDFPNPNQELLQLFQTFDDIVMAHQGRVYPAKDARMSSPAFKAFFPDWKEYTNYIDPRFSSNFYRRVLQVGL